MLSLLPSFLTLSPLQDFSSRETDFYFHQFLSNFLKYSSSNLPSSHPYSIFAINFPVSQTSFSLYLHNQWTNFHKISCAGKPQMRAICTYVGCTKATTNDWDIRPSVAVKASSANISWTAEWICTIKLALESAHQSVSNDIWGVSKW